MLRDQIVRLCSKGNRDCNYDCPNCKDLNQILSLLREKIKKELLTDDEVVGSFFDKASLLDIENTLIDGLKEVAQAQLQNVLKALEEDK